MLNLGVMDGPTLNLENSIAIFSGCQDNNVKSKREQSLSSLCRQAWIQSICTVHVTCRPLYTPTHHRHYYMSTSVAGYCHVYTKSKVRFHR